MTAHCLFEQSGTFKNEFIKLGYDAFDYDILNQYGQTDFVIDLFKEIQKAHGGGTSIFDSFAKDDIVMAFFPCTMFQEQNYLLFKGLNYQQKNWTNRKKLEYCMNRHETLHEFYDCLCKLMIIAIDKDLQLIVENPATAPHYLYDFFPVKPSIKDGDRRNRGDYFKKPTNYWFVNCKPSNNFIFEPVVMKETKIITEVKGEYRQRKRSEISPDYANRFIREFLL